ncbi:MAG: RNA-binding transcriptional accessory protein [Deltaproteobacteria bacterium]|nr:RNA-binding transcriptional accessory protein [Deltaproteobacteria bacterium]
MPKTASFDPTATIATELALSQTSVSGVIRLLDEGNTVPFIARYRKEATGSLDEVAIRAIEERRDYLVELDKRRRAILKSIDEQGVLTDELRARIEACATKTELEDIYLPYKPKRRTRGSIARERGLEPLAVRILEQPATGAPEAEAARLVDAEKGVDDVEAALAGARDIVAETIAEIAEVRAAHRSCFAKKGVLRSRVARGKAAGDTVFRDYHDHREPAVSIPSHRYLAVRRGEREKVLKVGIEVDQAPLIDRALGRAGHRAGSPFAEQLRLAVEDGCCRLVAAGVESDVHAVLKERSDREAVDVFAANLRNLLLAAPFGTRPVIGVDPGLRTGCKCAALSRTGAYLGSMNFNLVHGDRALEAGRRELVRFVGRHRPAAIAVGNGTGGRDAEQFVRDTLAAEGLGDVIVVQVSEAGASVYSASPLAAVEHPDLDLTVRGAISIARRLQDPLAELVKIEPKAIGVGQYQHDVHQPMLARKLDEVVESCVNGVGVELNTASAPLLARVAGIGPKLADNIVAHRSSNGPFEGRVQLKKVKGLGPKAFEQAAGFLRLGEGKHPLDASAVHPERYRLVEGIAKDMGVSLADLVGDSDLASRIEVSRYVSNDVGEPTLRDIIAELERPGRDPRDEFEAPAFREDVREIEDLKLGMELEGVVTNVTNFGAFVDVGVHRDGLVHISQLADRFVKDPAEVVKVGDKIKVRVLEVDRERNRISLSAKSERPPERKPEQRHDNPQPPPRRDRPPQREDKRDFSFHPFANLKKG